MVNFQKKLLKLSLTPNNSVVIGSGILNALKIRESHDIDVTVTKQMYEHFKQESNFKVVNLFGTEFLQNEDYEIGTEWNVGDINRVYSYEELYINSIVIDNVRYISLEFILEIKKLWIKSKNVRKKDIKDIQLIENYLKNKSWTCDKCKRVFKRRNQSHSCKIVPIDQHFRNKDYAKELYNFLLVQIKDKVGPYKIISLPCCIHLYGNYDFLAILPHKDRIEIRFASTDTIKNKRITQSVYLSKKLTKSCIDIKSKEEIDIELLRLLKDSYIISN